MTLFEPQDPLDLPRPDIGLTERVRFTVAYDGSGFHGFAEQPGIPTVAGDLRMAIERVLGHAVEIACAGRTDAGVHARGQVITFDARAEGLDLDALTRSINHQCGPRIAVRNGAVVDSEFDARFSATARRYRYLVLNRADPDPLLSGRAWHVERPLDLRAMQLASDPFIGKHDFSAFCRRPKRRDDEVASLERKVISAGWARGPDSSGSNEEGLLRFEIEANAFCHQMVRSVVGMLVAVGLGRRKAGEVAGVIRLGDRSHAADLAPPQGLMLMQVRYHDWTS